MKTQSTCPHHNADPSKCFTCRAMAVPSNIRPKSAPKPVFEPEDWELELNTSPALARRSDPDTSHEAAMQVNVTERELQVFNALVDMGGRGCNEQIIDFMGEEQTGNISGRIKPLRRKGWLRWSGAYHKSRQGRRQRVWEVVPENKHMKAIDQFLLEDK